MHSGVSKLIHHGGVASTYGCLKCKIKTEASNGRCFTQVDNFEYRSVEEYTNIPSDGLFVSIILNTAVSFYVALLICFQEYL
jgi:hypothetical protein